MNSTDEVHVEATYDLDFYQNQASTLAVYGKDKAISYPCLGLVEEVGELLACEVEDVDKLVKEMGDVMWYSAALCTDLGIRLSEAWTQPKVQMIPDTEAIYQNAFKCAGRVKKILRGDANREEKVVEVRGLVGDIIRRIEVLAAKYGSSLESVCETNLDKLFDRRDRGVLRGDGDNR